MTPRCVLVVEKFTETVRELKQYNLIDTLVSHGFYIRTSYLLFYLSASFPNIAGFTSAALQLVIERVMSNARPVRAWHAHEHNIGQGSC